MEPRSSRDPAFDLDAAYAVEADHRRHHQQRGWQIIGLKVGYANRAVWRALKLETLVWAAMYDQTVRHADSGFSSLSAEKLISPKIEPEVVVKMKEPVTTDDIMQSIEWIALGFEIIDCVYPDWKFQPPDFVAAFGLHAALMVGTPLIVTSNSSAEIAAQLAQFKVRLYRNGQLVEVGAGKNALKSPALCIRELTEAITRRNADEPLLPGWLVSTGTLTTSQPCSGGEEWKVNAEGMDLKELTLRLG
jgi:2-oxo-3-hexenedioate decarboxylase